MNSLRDKVKDAIKTCDFNPSLGVDSVVGDVADAVFEALDITEKEQDLAGASVEVCAPDEYEIIPIELEISPFQYTTLTAVLEEEIDRNGREYPAINTACRSLLMAIRSQKEF